MEPDRSPRVDDAIRLRDGGRLAFAERGDPVYLPLLSFHGVPGSRLWMEHPATAALGVRLITIDRPGYGRCDVKPRASLESWLADFED